MSEELLTPIEMGFAEFVAKLISETFGAIVVSHTEQEQQLASITELVSQPLDTFAQQVIFDAEIETELTRLFPSEDKAHPHAAFVGAPYQRETRRTPENPPFRTILGVEFEEGDVVRARLTESAVEKIKQAVRSLLAAPRYNALREVVTRGVPRVIVDSGHINAKLTFRITLLEDEPEEEPAPAPVPLSPVAPSFKTIVGVSPLDRFVGLTRPFTDPNVRLTVHQVNAQAPQTTQVQANVFSEVEVTFKTVT